MPVYRSWLLSVVWLAVRFQSDYSDQWAMVLYPNLVPIYFCTSPQFHTWALSLQAASKSDIFSTRNADKSSEFTWNTSWSCSKYSRRQSPPVGIDVSTVVIANPSFKSRWMSMRFWIQKAKSLSRKRTLFRQAKNFLSRESSSTDRL